MRSLARWAVAWALAVVAAGCAETTGSAASGGELIRLRVQVLREIPHDPAAFTQGLVITEGRLLESTGQYGESSLREVDRATGEVLREKALGEEYFGEGLARLDGLLIQLTWKAGVAFGYDEESWEERRRWSYDGEGWGLCTAGDSLWMSDGSDTLVRRDLGLFSVVQTLPVTIEGRPLQGLNELECAEGWIYANVYPGESIVRIDPLTGNVAALIDASGLLHPNEREGTDVLNGIAYDSQSETFWITGKYWPRMFEVRFVAAEGATG